MDRIEPYDGRPRTLVQVEIGTRRRLYEEDAVRMGGIWRERVKQYRGGIYHFYLTGCGRAPWLNPKIAEYVRLWARAAGMDDRAVARRLVGPRSHVRRFLPDVDLYEFLEKCGVFSIEE